MPNLMKKHLSKTSIQSWIESRFVRRLVASLVGVFFISSNILYPTAFATPKPIALQEKIQKKDGFEIPESLGTVISTSLNAQEKIPNVFLIQDAHAIPSAQKNLGKLTQYLQENYGIQTVALEGADGEIDATLFKTFPDKQKRDGFFNDLLERGEISGVATASVLSQFPSKYIGLEDWALYQKGTESFLKSMETKSEKIGELELLKQNLQKLKNKYFSKELLEFNYEQTRWEEETRNIASFLKYLLRYKNLADTESEILNILKIIDEENKELDAQTNAEIKALAERIEKKLKDKTEIIKFNKLKQEVQTSQINKIEFLSESVKLLPEEIADVSPTVWQKVLQHRRLNALTGKEFLNSLESFLENVEKNLIFSNAEKQILKMDEQLLLLGKLFRLELTRGSLKKIKKFFSENVSSKNADIAELNESIYKFAKNSSNDVFYNFYNIAEERETVFEQKLFLLKNLSDVLVVLGGFHTDAVAEKLRSKNISYAIISPVIKDIPADDRYLKQMTGNVSWSKYFVLNNGQINLYDSLARAFVDNVRVKGNVEDAKLWRNEIIRLLAGQKRVSEYGKYAAYIADENFKKKKSEWIVKLQSFIERLKFFDRNGQLTEQNIASIFAAQTHQTPYAVASFVPNTQIQVSFPSAQNDKTVRSESRTDFETRRSFRFNNHYGIHIRPSSLLADFAWKSFEKLGLKVSIRKNNEELIPMTSTFLIRELGIASGDQIEILIEGEQPQTLREQVANLIEQVISDSNMLEEEGIENPKYELYVEKLNKISEQQTFDIDDAAQSALENSNGRFLSWIAEKGFGGIVSFANAAADHFSNIGKKSLDVDFDEIEFYYQNEIVRGYPSIKSRMLGIVNTKGIFIFNARVQDEKNALAFGIYPEDYQPSSRSGSVVKMRHKNIPNPGHGDGVLECVFQNVGEVPKLLMVPVFPGRKAAAEDFRKYTSDAARLARFLIVAGMPKATRLDEATQYDIVDFIKKGGGDIRSEQLQTLNDLIRLDEEDFLESNFENDADEQIQRSETRGKSDSRQNLGEIEFYVRDEMKSKEETKKFLAEINASNREYIFVAKQPEETLQINFGVRGSDFHDELGSEIEGSLSGVIYSESGEREIILVPNFENRVFGNFGKAIKDIKRVSGILIENGLSKDIKIGKGNKNGIAKLYRQAFDSEPPSLPETLGDLAELITKDEIDARRVQESIAKSEVRSYSESNFINKSLNAMKKLPPAVNGKPQKVSVVISTKNGDRFFSPEENRNGQDSLLVKIEQLQELFSLNPSYDWELIIVDDNSPDGRTGKRILEKAKLLYPDDVEKGKIRVLFSQNKESRKGGAIVYGISDALSEYSDYIVYTDVDLSTDLRQIGLLLNSLVVEKNGIAIGSRRLKKSQTIGRTNYREFSSWFYNNLVGLILPLLRNIKDTQCGFKAMSRDAALETMPFVKDFGMSFDTEILLLAREKGLSIEEIPIYWEDYRGGTSIVVASETLKMIQGLLDQSLRHQIRESQYWPIGTQKPLAMIATQAAKEAISVLKAILKGFMPLREIAERPSGVKIGEELRSIENSKKNLAEFIKNGTKGKFWAEDKTSVEDKIAIINSDYGINLLSDSEVVLLEGFSDRPQRPILITAQDGKQYVFRRFFTDLEKTKFVVSYQKHFNQKNIDEVPRLIPRKNMSGDRAEDYVSKIGDYYYVLEEARFEGHIVDYKDATEKHFETIGKTIARFQNISDGFAPEGEKTDETLIGVLKARDDLETLLKLTKRKSEIAGFENLSSAEKIFIKAIPFLLQQMEILSANLPESLYEQLPQALTECDIGFHNMRFSENGEDAPSVYDFELVRKQPRIQDFRNSMTTFGMSTGRRYDRKLMEGILGGYEKAIKTPLTEEEKRAIPEIIRGTFLWTFVGLFFVQEEKINNNENLRKTVELSFADFQKFAEDFSSGNIIGLSSDAAQGDGAIRSENLSDDYRPSLMAELLFISNQIEDIQIILNELRKFRHSDEEQQALEKIEQALERVSLEVMQFVNVQGDFYDEEGYFKNVSEAWKEARRCLNGYSEIASEEKQNRIKDVDVRLYRLASRLAGLFEAKEVAVVEEIGKVEKINDADDFEGFVSDLLYRLNKDSSNYIFLTEILKNPQKYETNFLNHIGKMILGKLSEDFDSAKQFVDSSQLILDKEGFMSWRKALVENNSMFVKEFEKIVPKRKDVSIDLYGQMLFFIGEGFDRYFEIIYDKLIGTKPPVAIYNPKRSYHARAMSSVHMRTKHLLFGEKTADDKYKDSRITYLDDEFDQRSSANAEKVKKAINIWKDVAAKDKLEMLRRIDNFLETTWVEEIAEQGEKISPLVLIVADAEANVARVVHTDRLSRTLFFTKAYLDTLDINNDADMRELAVWLNVSQNWLDQSEKKSADVSNLENDRKVEDNKQDLNRRFFELEDTGLLSTDELKQRLSRLMRNHILNRYHFFVGRVAEKEEQAFKLIKLGEQRIRDFSKHPEWNEVVELRDPFRDAVKPLKDLIFQYEAMGMRKQVDIAFQRFLYAISMVQKFDPGGLLPWGFQVDLIFMSLRLDYWGHFKNEVELFLTGRESDTWEPNARENQEEQKSWKRGFWRRGFPRKFSSINAYEIEYYSLRANGWRFFRRLKLEMMAQLSASYPEHRLKRSAIVRSIYELLEESQKNPLKSLKEKIAARGEALELEELFPKARSVEREINPLGSKLETGDGMVVYDIENAKSRPSDLFEEEKPWWVWGGSSGLIRYSSWWNAFRSLLHVYETEFNRLPKHPEAKNKLNKWKNVFAKDLLEIGGMKFDKLKTKLSLIETKLSEGNIDAVRKNAFGLRRLRWLRSEPELKPMINLAEEISRLAEDSPIRNKIKMEEVIKKLKERLALAESLITFLRVYHEIYFKLRMEEQVPHSFAVDKAFRMSLEKCRETTDAMKLLFFQFVYFSRKRNASDFEWLSHVIMSTFVRKNTQQMLLPLDESFVIPQNVERQALPEIVNVFIRVLDLHKDLITPNGYEKIDIDGAVFRSETRAKIIETIVGSAVENKKPNDETVQKFRSEIYSEGLETIEKRLWDAFNNVFIPTAMANITSDGLLVNAYAELEKMLVESKISSTEFSNAADFIFNNQLKSLSESIEKKEIEVAAPIIFYSNTEIMRNRLFEFIKTIQQGLESNNYQIFIVCESRKEVQSLRTELGQRKMSQGVRVLGEEGMDNAVEEMRKSVFENKKFSESFGAFFPSGDVAMKVTDWKRKVHNEIPEEYAMLLLPALTKYFAVTRNKDLNSETLAIALQKAFPDISSSVKFQTERGIVIAIEVLQSIIAAVRQIATAA